MDTRTTATPDRLALDLARRQHGVIGHRQARRMGLSAKQIWQRVHGSGNWEQVAPGVPVYRVAGAPRTWRGEVCIAILRATGDLEAGAVSGAAALHLRAPSRFPRPPLIEVAVARGGHRRVPGVVVRELRGLAPDVTRADGIPCVHPTRCAIEAAAGLDVDDVTTLLEDLVAAGLTGRWALFARASALARGRAGAAAVCALTSPGAEAVFRSQLEREGAAALDEAGLGPYEVNVVLADAHGRVREVDVLFRAARLVVEWDGARFHQTEAQRRRDRAGDRRLVVAGWRVLRFGWREVRTGPHRVGGQVAAALAL